MAHPANQESPYASYFVSQVDYSPSSSLVKKLKAGARVIYSGEAQRKIDQIAEDTNPQLAHLHNIAHQLSPSILYALRRRSIPIVQTLHDLKLVCPTYTMYTQGQICERCLKGQYYNVVRYRCNKGSLLGSVANMVEMYLHRTLLHSYEQIDAFIAPSAFLRKKMIEGGLAPERIHHIPNFIAATDYLPQYENEGYLLFLGQLIPVKGLDVLLQALRFCSNVHLIVAGEGADRLRFEAFSKNHGLNVSFVGFQTGNNLQKLSQNSLAVIVPSVWYENLPYSILEAFAYGKPVIASRLGGMAELVDDGETGYLFEAGNPQALAETIQRAVSDPNKLIEMGRVARAKVEQEFSPERHLEQIMNVYTNIL